MSGFSPEWLALREPVDHRSRDVRLARALSARLQAREEVSVLDLGCGTGSNLRATAHLLGRRQAWTLVDYDARLLAAAHDRLQQWADRAAPLDGSGLRIEKGGRTLTVRFHQADLTREVERLVVPAPDLVTASALFDLCSEPFIERFARAVAAAKAAFYTVLTYDGVQTWTPAHAADGPMAAAFHAHQRTDKGFGAAAGPDAPVCLGRAFKSVGYSVDEGDSPWVLGPADAGLIADLATGFADAVAETGRVDAATLAAWRAIARTGSVVGHKDTLAVP